MKEFKILLRIWAILMCVTGVFSLLDLLEGKKFDIGRYVVVTLALLSYHGCVKLNDFLKNKNR